MEQHLALHAVLIPSLFAAIACGVSRFIPFLRRFTPVLVPLAIAAVAVRAGVVQEGSSILSAWPPATRWITAIACIMAMGCGGSLLGLFAIHENGRGPLAAAILAGAFSGGIVLALLALPGESTAGMTARTAVASGLLAMVLSIGKVRGPGIFLSLAFPAAALAGLLLLSGSAKLAVTAGSVAFACGLLGLLSIPLRITLGAGGVGVMTVALATLAAEGRAYDYESFPGWIWTVVALSPLAGALADLALARLLPDLVRFALRTVPPILISGSGLLLAAWKAGVLAVGDSTDPYGP
jgi:hypothetical protein